LNITGLKVYLLEGIRGENENSFGVIFKFESEKDRNKYWKEEEGGVLTELGEAVIEKISPTSEELNKLGIKEYEQEVRSIEKSPATGKGL